MRTIWLHTYAKLGVRDEISKFELNTFTHEYFKNMLESKVFKIYFTNKIIISLLV